MATEVFISWSGDLSRKLGEALRDWLPAALQYVTPYFSPEDIEKGTKWDKEIAAKLESSNIGVICLTPDNTEKPWILFEAGALSKSMDKPRVCTLLFGIESTDVKGPLSSFQATRFVREDFKKLITTINNSAGEAKLDTGVLDDVFEMWWPILEGKVQEILAAPDRHTAKERRTERDMIEEVLELTRMNAKRQGGSNPAMERAIIRLMDSWVQAYNRTPTGSISRLAIARLGDSLQDLCAAAGLPEMYGQYRDVLHRGGSAKRDPGQDQDDDSPDRPRTREEDGE